MNEKTAILSIVLCFAAAAPALAWTPSLDEPTAQLIVDDAFGRNTGDKVLTYATVDLGVKDGQFAAGQGAATVYSGDASCVQNWLASPADFKQFGSRPASVTAYGQADYAYWAAVRAHDDFKFMTAKDAVDAAKQALPDGRVRVELKLQGLSAAKLRDAYNVVVLLKDGKIVRPEKVNFLNDWAQAGDAWNGTMAYNFDLSAALKDNPGLANEPLAVLFRTEAKQNCAYRVNVPLAKFK